MLLDAVLHFTLQLTITNYTNLLHLNSQPEPLFQISHVH